MTVFSPQQEAALAAVAEWLPGARRRTGPPIFRLFGFAGTGKTTLARHIADDIDGKVLFAAFTGKAAQVMRSKGCRGASTIHSLIYRPRDTESETPSFDLWDEAPASRAKLIIVDECSMVDSDLGNDLLSFGVPILVLGDPAQLPPVKGGGFFTEAEPDAMLTEVHRQAAGDPIVRLSMAIREGERIEPGDYGSAVVVHRRELDPARVLEADQVLVGRNATRKAYNERLRLRRGIEQPLPVAGDRLVCLRNNRSKGLFNGSLWRASEIRPPRGTTLRLRITAEDETPERTTAVSIFPECFTGGIEELPWERRRAADEFDYGYVLTVHKAQGSQWDDVVLFDESFAFQDHRARWLYTGVTRAAKRLTIVL